MNTIDTNEKRIITNIVFKEESYKIIGACFNVHKNLGKGFLESVYSEALAIEFDKEKIPFTKEKKLTVFYDGKPLKKYFKADFLCYDSIIIELKAINYLSKLDFQQAINYLKATNFKLALLVNFGSSSLSYKRIIN